MICASVALQCSRYLVQLSRGVVLATLALAPGYLLSRLRRHRTGTSRYRTGTSPRLRAVEPAQARAYALSNRHEPAPTALSNRHKLLRRY
jgi:hypothetical protein